MRLKICLAASGKEIRNFIMRTRTWRPPSQRSTTNTDPRRAVVSRELHTSPSPLLTSQLPALPLLPTYPSLALPPPANNPTHLPPVPRPLPTSRQSPMLLPYHVGAAHAATPARLSPWTVPVASKVDPDLPLLTNLSTSPYFSYPSLRKRNCQKKRRKRGGYVGSETRSQQRNAGRNGGLIVTTSAVNTARCALHRSNSRRRSERWSEKRRNWSSCWRHTAVTSLPLPASHTTSRHPPSQNSSSRRNPKLLAWNRKLIPSIDDIFFWLRYGCFFGLTRLSFRYVITSEYIRTVFFYHCYVYAVKYSESFYWRRERRLKGRCDKTCDQDTWSRKRGLPHDGFLQWDDDSSFPSVLLLSFLLVKELSFKILWCV